MKNFVLSERTGTPSAPFKAKFIQDLNMLLPLEIQYRTKHFYEPQNSTHFPGFLHRNVRNYSNLKICHLCVIACYNGRYYIIYINSK